MPNSGKERADRETDRLIAEQYQAVVTRCTGWKAWGKYRYSIVQTGNGPAFAVVTFRRIIGNRHVTDNVADYEGPSTLQFPEAFLQELQEKHPPVNETAIQWRRQAAAYMAEQRSRNSLITAVKRSFARGEKPQLRLACGEKVSYRPWHDGRKIRLGYYNTEKAKTEELFKEMIDVAGTRQLLSKKNELAGSR